MTITQPDLFSPIEARDDAISRADLNADPAWRELAYLAVLWCAHIHPDFTADEVWHRLALHDDITTHEPSAIGPVFLRASHAGRIRKTGEQRASTNPIRHRDLTVWTRA